MAQDRAPPPPPERSGEPLRSSNRPDAHSDPKRPYAGTYFLGRYRVVDEIGTGGMASVHLARMDGPGGFQKWVAIKRIHAHLVEDESFVNMFLDEARVAARISHPNVATVFELGKHDGTYWIAMEYLHGEPLRELMRRNSELGQPISPEIACRIIADAAEGLHAAHELVGNNGETLNLVHRDVTPHNLFVTYEGTTKVVDFGIAKFSSRMASTRAGTLKGKLAYMSPEQVQGETIDRRTDIFALGVVLWELTTGSRLFRTDNDLDTLAKVQECNVPRPSKLVRGYPIDLEKIVMKTLAKNKNERFRTARELSRALQSLLMRRGLFVGGDEISVYVKGIFQDRIEKREAHLRWAAEVTQTISRDGQSDSPPKGSEGSGESSNFSYSADGPPPPNEFSPHSPAAGRSPTRGEMAQRGSRASTMPPPKYDWPRESRPPPRQVTKSGPPPTRTPSEAPRRAEDSGGAVTKVEQSPSPGFDANDSTIVTAPPSEIFQLSLRSSTGSGRPPKGGSADAHDDAGESFAQLPTTQKSEGLFANPGETTVTYMTDDLMSQASLTLHSLREDQRTVIARKPLRKRRNRLVMGASLAAAIICATCLAWMFAHRDAKPTTLAVTSSGRMNPTVGEVGREALFATVRGEFMGILSTPPPPVLEPLAGDDHHDSPAPTGMAPGPAAGKAAPAAQAGKKGASAPATTPKKPAAGTTEEGLLSVICIPGCDQVFDNGKLIGPSPIFKKVVPVGEHHIKLVRHDSSVTRTTVATVTAGVNPTVVRQSMSP